MKGDRDPLLDELVKIKGRLYRAQTLLIDAYAMIDDTLADGLDTARASAMLVDLGFFLEVVPWEREPQPAARQGAITLGEAPQVSS